MIRTERNEYVPDVVSPPGETLMELLEERGISQAELAKRTGRPKKTINEIVRGKAAITPDTALELELVLGAPAQFWNQRESDYRAFLAKKAERARLTQWLGWVKQFPLRAMAKLGWIKPFADKASQVREVLSFFGVASPEEWREVYERPQAAFRKSTAFHADVAALSAWLRQGTRQAESIQCQPFDAGGFKAALAQVRSATSKPIREAVAVAVEQCSNVGVVLVFTHELPGSLASGCTRWLSPTKALIQLSLRYKTADHLWFTFFHEAGHILLHGKTSVFIEDKAKTGQEEHEANVFASDQLIEPTVYAQFVSAASFTHDSIKWFAQSIGIAPGIVVGRLQHEKLIPFSHCNDLKTKLQWSNKNTSSS